MFEEIESRGARRRRRTQTVASRRRFDHLALIHGGDASNVACVCELAEYYFDKRRAKGCPCRKRTLGRPRVACGMCKCDQRKRIYRWRNQVRDLRLIGPWAAKNLELDSDLVALITSPHVKPR